MPTEHWKPDPDEHDYPAAADYLSLLSDEEAVAATVAALKAVPLTTRKAKDLLRASALPLLEAHNVHVAKDLAKIRQHVKLSPVLLLRGDLGRGLPLTIADGYHRICASHLVDEDAEIPCRIVDRQPAGPVVGRATT
jgi:hypothetical protein